MNPTRPGGVAAWLSAPWLPVAVLLFSSSMWGLSWLPLKAFAEHGLSGPLLAMLTYGLLGVVGLPWLWRERALWLRDKRLLLALVVLGGWGNAAFVSALVLGDVVRVMLLFYLAPVWSVLGGRFFLGEAVSPRRAGAVALALIGAFLVVGGLSVFDAPLHAADVLALTSGMGFACNNIVSRAAQAIPTATKTVGLCIGCALMALLMMAVTGPAAPAVSMPSAGVIAGLLAYSLIGLALVIVTWQWSVTRLEAGRSGVLAIAELLVAMLTATLIGDETMLPREWLGAALIVAAAVLEATDSAESACPPQRHHTQGNHMSTVWMNQLSWVDYEARLKRDQPAILLPVGALEQHGPHLPLGTDGMLSSAVAADAAARIGALVAPGLSYGYKSQPKCGGGQHFCGTTSVDAATMIGSVRDAVREFARHGATKLVIVNGHYENQWFITEGIDLGLRDVGGSAALQVMRLEYWDFLSEATLATVFPDGFPGYALEHAAVIETSLMLHYHPSLVRLDLIPDEPPVDFPPYDVYPTRKHWVPLSGVLSSARGSSADKGEAMAHELSVRIAAAITHEFG